MSVLHSYAGSEATSDSEHAVGRCATRTEPVPRGPCVDCEPASFGLPVKSAKPRSSRVSTLRTLGRVARRYVLLVYPSIPCRKRIVGAREAQLGHSHLATAVDEGHNKFVV